jgi:hypothetical protein
MKMMVLNKFTMSLALLCAACGPAIAETVLSCPSAIHDHKLTQIDMFSGPPHEMASLIPIDGGWNTTMDNPQELPFYIQCSYKNTKKTIVIKVPANATSCKYGDKIDQIICE